ncbi:hypothetical protein DPMN_083781 [Dreissena polymorpha]|uniref:Uncharacterized protein n=1 Tax=Dreissena polymorpha TaxID=45954 RepID=A0A9D3YDK9_DREPO|nr:hypothetical protein DPMN_083781 [Dreissena polymorpha]
MIGPKLKTAPPTGGHTNILTKLHEDWALNVTSTVFELDRDIIGTNLLTKFHEDWTINVASRVFMNKCERTDEPRTNTGHKRSPEQSVLTCLHYIHIEKNAPTTGGHVFSPIWTIFKLFLDDWAKNVTSRVFTRKTAPPTGGHFHEDRTINVAYRTGHKSSPETSNKTHKITKPGVVVIWCGGHL